MKIREIDIKDIPQLIEVDKKAYGEFGADEKYFLDKINLKNTKILVVEDDDRVTGFAVYEILKKDELPPDFIELNTNKPFDDSWVHIIAFTTETNYQDIASDSKLVEVIEKSVNERIFCTSLSIDHPFINHDVFGFWEKNGYKKSGTIKWVSDSNKDKIECYVYKKVL